MDKIYKYVPLESGLNILSNNSVKLNNPQNYNDPFDSIIEFSTKDIEKTKSIIAEYFIILKILEFFKNNKVKMNLITKLILKWDIFMININLRLSKTENYFKIYGIDKIFSYIFHILSKDKQEMIKNVDNLIEEKIIKQIKNVRNDTFVSCFSKKKDSILMWSHYADCHRGVCIEFEKPKENFVDVKYSKKRSNFNFEDTTRRVLGYILSDEQVNVSNRKIIYNVLRPFFTKSKDWKYEEEVRCILNKDCTGVYKKEGITLYEMPTQISRVYLGCKIDTSAKEYMDLIKIAKEKNIEVVTLKASECSYSLEQKHSNESIYLKF